MKKSIIRNSLFAAIMLCLCTCSTDSQYDEKNTPDIPNHSERREVLLTLKNKLATNSFSSRTIAMAEENAIATLDVYVFGCETENGTYTFQQRFAYRSDEAAEAAPLPQGAEELQLADAADGDRSVTTGLLSLKRGLFVKLYCIANDTILVNPATNKGMKAKDFIPIKFDQTDGKTSIASVGVPMERDFLKFHTALLEGGKPVNAKGDVLLTPLAMSGAMDTPLDLTDPDNSSRLQTRLRLTRLTARFDIANNEAESRFTIRSVSMGNARRGASFFPIAAHGDAQAKDGELVTLTERSFDGANANKGLQTGAFYTYPSPQEDNGYLIVKGDYRVNETENKEVSYRIPFRRKNPDGTQTLLEINNNHRYTIGITRADDYHLDFTLNVADWADDGSVDDYQPENKPGEITIKIPDAFKDDTEDDYDPARKIHTISMSLKRGSSFDAFIGTTSPLTVSKTYAGGAASRKYDWLQIDEPLITRIATSTYRYTFSLKEGYVLGRYPRATVRIFDALSGNESILYVDALSVPQPIETQQPPKAPNGFSDNPNSFDPEALTASLYRINDSRTDVRISCPDGLEVQNVPAWLEAEPTEQSGAETLYTLTLKDREVQETGARVVFCNKKRPELKAEVGIELKDASIQPSFDGVGTDNTYTPPAAKDEQGNVDMKITDGNTCQVNATSMDGVAVKIEYPDGGPEWLTHDAEAATAKTKATATSATTPIWSKSVAAMPAAPTADNRRETVTFSLVNAKLAGAKPAIVTLVNKIGGPDHRFTVTPQMQLGTMEKASSVPADDKIGTDRTITLYKLPDGKTSAMDVKVTSYGGSTLTSSDDAVIKVTKSVTPRAAGSGVTQDDNNAWYTLTAVSAGTPTSPRTAKLTHNNRTDNTRKEEYTVNVIASDITGDDATLLTPQNGQTAKFLISSPLGFKAAVTDYKADEGGKLWLKLNADEYAGKENAEVIVTAISELTNVHPVTLTLTNNIADGGNKTLTVTPVYAVPALSVVASTANPVANSLEGTQGANVKLKLIRIAGSTIKLKATAIGGTKITNVSGVTVTNAAGSYATSNEYQITLASATTASGSFKVVNRQNDTKVTTVTVEAPLPDIKANSLSVNVANGAETQIPVNSGAGLTASVTSWGSGGQAWFDFTTAKVDGGDKKIVIQQKTNLSALVIKPATILLKNNIAGGTDKTITVSPQNFATPTVAKTGTPSPVQNTMSGTTINLYRVNNSALSITASALGNTQILSPSNVTVTGAGTAASPYQVKLNNTNVTSGSFIVANKSDNSKRTTITVTGLSADITVNNANLTVTAANSGNTSFGGINSPEGCTASLLNNSWNGGGQWFDFAKSSVEKGNNKVFTITQRNNVNTTMKAVTIRLTNNIAGGPSKDITLTPTGFVAPILNATTTELTGIRNYSTTLSITATAGGWSYVSNSNSNVVTVSANGTTYTITPLLSQGNTTLTFKNNSDANKTATKTFTVKNSSVNYNGKAPWYYFGYYIAPEDASSSAWDANLSSTYCANKTGGSWHVPSADEWKQILNTESGFAPDAVYNEYINAGVFAAKCDYWSSTVDSNSKSAIVAAFNLGLAMLGYSLKSDSEQVRCVAR